MISIAWDQSNHTFGNRLRYPLRIGERSNVSAFVISFNGNKINSLIWARKGHSIRLLFNDAHVMYSKKITNRLSNEEFTEQNDSSFSISNEDISIIMLTTGLNLSILELNNGNVLTKQCVRNIRKHAIDLAKIYITHDMCRIYSSGNTREMQDMRDEENRINRWVHEAIRDDLSGDYK